MFPFLDTFKAFVLGQPYLATTVFGLVILLAYDLKDRYGVDQGGSGSKPTAPGPPRVPYLLPWIGSAIAMGKNPDLFFQRVRLSTFKHDNRACLLMLIAISSNLGPVFKVKAVGQDLTYITSPDLISAVYRDTKVLSIAMFFVQCNSWILMCPIVI